MKWRTICHNDDLNSLTPMIDGHQECYDSSLKMQAYTSLKTIASTWTDFDAAASSSRMTSLRPRQTFEVGDCQAVFLTTLRTTADRKWRLSNDRVCSPRSLLRISILYIITDTELHTCINYKVVHRSAPLIVLFLTVPSHAYDIYTSRPVIGHVSGANWPWRQFSLFDRTRRRHPRFVLVTKSALANVLLRTRYTCHH